VKSGRMHHLLSLTKLQRKETKMKICRKDFGTRCEALITFMSILGDITPCGYAWDANLSAHVMKNHPLMCSHLDPHVTQMHMFLLIQQAQHGANGDSLALAIDMLKGRVLSALCSNALMRITPLQLLKV
jgi:hypothetical protein